MESAWNKFLKQCASWPTLKIGKAGHAVPFSAQHLQTYSPLWREATEEGKIEPPDALFTESEIDPVTDEKFQQVWFYFNGLRRESPETLDPVYMAYLGESPALSQPLRKALVLAKQAHFRFQQKQRDEAEKVALKALNEYVFSFQTTRPECVDNVLISADAQQLLSKHGFVFNRNTNRFCYAP